MSNSNLRVRGLARNSLLAAMAAMCQVSAALFPGPGHFISAFATLPVAAAAKLSPKGGIYCVLAASWLTFMIQPAELPILLLNTAPLGWILGSGLAWAWPSGASILTGAVGLTLGMLVTTYILGIPSFNKLLHPDQFAAVIAVYFGFTLAYSYAWHGFLRKFLDRLRLFF